MDEVEKQAFGSSSANLIEQPVPKAHFVGLALSYLALVLFCIWFGTAGIASFIFACTAFAVCAATMQLSAMWAALGPGVYWQRSLLALLVGAVVAVGAYLGLLFTGAFPNPLAGIGVFLCVGPVVWLLAQLPFFLVRYFCHWHLGARPANGQFGITDIFGFLSVAAVCFACLQFSVLLPDRADDANNFQMIGGSISSACVLSIVLQLCVALPSMSVLFTSESSHDGCARIFGVGACLVLGGFFLMILLGGVFRAGPQLPVLAFTLAVFIGVFTAAFGLPLMFHREAGIRLWNKVRIQAWNESLEGKNNAANIDQAMAEVGDFLDAQSPS